jgi:predicted outer membrane repeat protein
VAATVQGLTVTNGSAPDGWGGGLYAAAALTLSRMTVSNNTAVQSDGGAGYGGGGGAYIAGAAVIQDSVFSGNRFTATVTCGFCYGGGALFIGAAQVTNTVFSGNVATSTVATLPGGGAAFQNSAWVAGSRFESNQARSHGGGAYFTPLGQQFQLTGTVFLSNTAGSFGGGFYAIMLGSVVGSVTNTAFLGNSAGSHGGGAEMIGATGRFVNVLFARNTAGTSGAAVYGSSNQLLDLQHVTIVSPTLVAASAIQGNAIAITNSIVASHTIGLNGDTVSHAFNLFYGNTLNLTGTVTGGPVLTGDPAFYDTQAYTLTAASAAIDVGTDIGVSADYFGAPRPQGLDPDLGYAESATTRPARCFTEYNGGGTDFSSYTSRGHKLRFFKPLKAQGQ